MNARNVRSWWTVGLGYLFGTALFALGGEMHRAENRMECSVIDN